MRGVDECTICMKIPTRFTHKGMFFMQPLERVLLIYNYTIEIFASIASSYVKANI